MSGEGITLHGCDNGRHQRHTAGCTGAGVLSCSAGAMGAELAGADAAGSACCRSSAALALALAGGAADGSGAAAGAAAGAATAVTIIGGWTGGWGTPFCGATPDVAKIAAASALGLFTVGRGLVSACTASFWPNLQI